MWYLKTVTTVAMADPAARVAKNALPTEHIDFFDIKDKFLLSLKS